MRIYNYLFYNTNLLAQRLNNFDNTPFLGAMVVGGCLGFNIFTVYFLLEGFGINTGIELKNGYGGYVFWVLIGLLTFYYSYKGRCKKIVSYYEQKRKGKQLHPVIVIIIYFVSSFLLGLLAAMFKGHDLVHDKNYKHLIFNNMCY